MTLDSCENSAGKRSNAPHNGTQCASDSIPQRKWQESQVKMMNCIFFIIIIKSGPENNKQGFI